MKSLLVVFTLSSVFGLTAFSAARCRVFFDTNEASVTETQIRELVDKSKSYQDRRNKEWSERNKCLCCHTTLPFVLSRGLDSASRENFEKFRALAIEKVENADANPWYHSDHAGQNSKPTEAVLNAITLLMYDISSQSGLKASTLKAIDRIFENVDASGRLHWLDFNLEPFESKKGEVWGNSMAVLAVELAQKNSHYRAPAVKYTRLKNQIFQDTANLHPNEMSVLLWAHSLSGDVLKSSQVSAFVRQLQRAQNADGSWNQKAVLGQGKNQPDTYATSIALIGLIKAGQQGPGISKAATWLGEQQKTGNLLSMGEGTSLWPALSMNRPDMLFNNRFASDFATSYASLALQMYRSEVLHAP